MLSKCCKSRIICSLNSSLEKARYDLNDNNCYASLEIDYRCSECRKIIKLDCHPELYYSDGVERVVENYLENV